MPVSRSIFGSQPSLFSFVTSSTLRGVPSGFDVSNRSVGFRAHDVAGPSRRVPNRQVDAGADVDVLVGAVVIHQVDARVGEVLDVQELPHRRPGSPDLDLRILRRPCIVELADQGRQHVARREVEVVAWPVQLGRHRRDEVAPVLAPIRLAQLDARDLGDGVPLVRRLQGPGEQLVFGDRLGRLPG